MEKRQDHLNPKYIKAEIEVKIEDTTREIMKIGMGQNRLSSRDRGQFRQDRGRHRFEQSYRRNYRENPRNYGRQSSRGEHRSNSYRSDSCNRGRNRLEKGCFPEDMVIELGTQATVCQGQDLE